MKILKYSEELLKNVQRAELEILRDFQELCKKHGLRYFAIGGTALGTLRHKGFIPWDDDIDVGMPREDYEKFVQIADRDYADRYTIVNAERFSECSMMNTHWSRNGTRFCERVVMGASYPCGIFLDIFPFDPLPDSDAAMKRQAYAAWIWDKLLILSLLPKPVVRYGPIKTKIVLAGCAVVHAVLSLFPKAPAFFRDRCKKTCMKYTGQKTGRCGYLCSVSPFGNMIDISELYPLQEMPFEDTVMMMPAQAHAMLTRAYGDYMQLPPPEKRVNHAPEIVEFGENFPGEKTV